MSPWIAMTIEGLVALLLAVTIGYCITLDRRLQRLRADETQMRATVVDLGLATDQAERAIDSLRRTLTECDQSLAERLRVAERTTSELENQINVGEEVLTRIGRIVTATRNSERVEAGQAIPATPKLAETVAAAQAFAVRTRQRVAEQLS